MNTTNPTHIQDVIVVFDESGSMSSMGNEPLEAMNAFVDEQKTCATKGARFSLYRFGTDVQLDVDDIDLRDVKNVTKYTPGGLTALNDAICTAIHDKLKKKKKDNVVCVVITDGAENASQKYSRTDLQKLVEEVKIGHNWTFIYLGANQDSVEVGNGMGLEHCANFNQRERGSLTEVTRSASTAINEYRQSSADAPINTPVRLSLDMDYTPATPFNTPFNTPVESPRTSPRHSGLTRN
jgi:hypothetical protein